MNIPKKNINEYKEFDSIDKIYNYYSDEMESSNNISLNISPEEEFIAHCSNIHAWVENNYDPRILHSNLSYPLLKELSKHGNNKAKLSFAEYLLERYKENKSYSDIRGLRFLLEFFTDREIQDFILDNKAIYRDIIKTAWETRNLTEETIKRICKLVDTDIISQRKIYFSSNKSIDTRIQGLDIRKIISKLLYYKDAEVEIENRFFPKINIMRANITIKTHYCFFNGWIEASTREGNFKITAFNGLIGYKDLLDNRIKESVRISSKGDYIINDNNQLEYTKYGFKKDLTDFLKKACFSYVFQIERGKFNLIQKYIKKSEGW